jgi:hypothetical protein
VKRGGRTKKVVWREREREREGGAEWFEKSARRAPETRSSLSAVFACKSPSIDMYEFAKPSLYTIIYEQTHLIDRSDATVRLECNDLKW